MGCPLLGESRFQTQIVLSTIEADYIALSQDMRDLINFYQRCYQRNDQFAMELVLNPSCLKIMKHVSNLRISLSHLS
jgi:hypothetical protein